MANTNIEIKLWIDDVREPPTNEYLWIKSVNGAKYTIELEEKLNELYPNATAVISLIDIDHDAGDYCKDGGDYIKILDWLEETGRNYPIHIHSMNPVGVQNMRKIIQKNGWREI